MKQIIKQLYLPESPFWGLGDILRGYLSLANLCKEYGFTLELDYSLHPICVFLKNNHCTQTVIDITSIPVFHIEDQHELRDIIKNIYESNVSEFIFPMTTNMWYLTNGVSHETRQALRDSMIPTSELNEAIEDQMAIVGITGPFTAVHVRMGDAYLIDKTHNIDIYEKIYIQIKNQEDIVLFSDDLGLKAFMASKGVKVSPSRPCHLSGSNLQLEQVKQTLVDFFCLSKANHIYKCSLHGYGSGFVDWCADIFEIPTTQLDIDVEKSRCI
jgi:hypothetical protein